jgi:tetratricopeptide (TPR) repeat protein
MHELDIITALIAARDIKKAEVMIARLLRSPLTPPQQSQLFLQRARIRLLAARPDDALDDIKGLLAEAQHSTPPELLELMGDSYIARFELAPAGFADRHDIQRASELYAQIATDYPQYANLGWVYYQHGRAALILDKVNAAEQYFKRALFAPSHLPSLTAYCYERLGFIAFYEARQPHYALTCLDKAIHTCPADEPRAWLVDVHLLRSRVMSDVDLDNAIDAAHTALKIAREDNNEKKRAASALFMLAELLFKYGNRPSEVVEYLQQFLQVSRTPPGVDVTWSRVYEMLGDAYLHLARYEQAVNAYAAALQFNPYHPWEESIQLRMAHCCYLQQEYARAADILNAIIKRASAEGQPVKDYRIYNALGDSWFALGKYKDSASAYYTALSIAPADVDVSRIRYSYEQAQQNYPL